MPENVLLQISWGKPDSPVRLLCALCHGALPEVPVIIWKGDGAMASFCDPCAEKIFDALKPGLRPR